MNFELALGATWPSAKERACSYEPIGGRSKKTYDANLATVHGGDQSDRTPRTTRHVPVEATSRPTACLLLQTPDSRLRTGSMRPVLIQCYHDRLEQMVCAKDCPKSPRSLPKELRHGIPSTARGDRLRSPATGTASSLRQRRLAAACRRAQHTPVQVPPIISGAGSPGSFTYGEQIK